jgi:hypothetical protein
VRYCVVACRKVLFCDHAGSMGETCDQLLSLVVRKWKIGVVGIKNKGES